MPKTTKQIKPKLRPAKSQPARVQRRSAQTDNSDYLFQDEATLIGLTDPFSGEAAHARYPDQGAGRSLTWQQRFSISIMTSGDGQAAFVVNPKANFPYMKAVTFAGDVATWSGTWEIDANNLVTDFASVYRPTSMGVRFLNLLSATESAGSIVIAKAGPVSGGSTAFVPTNFSSWDEHPMEHGGEWHTTSHPRNANAYDMVPITSFSSNSDAGNPSWETVYMYLSGTKEDAIVMKIELYINYEYVAQEDASIAQLSFPQPRLNIPMQTAINHVQSSHPSASHKGPKSVIKGFIKKEAKKALLKHVLPFAAKKATQLLL